MFALIHLFLLTTTRNYVMFCFARGSAVSSRSGIWVGAPVEIELGAF